MPSPDISPITPIAKMLVVVGIVCICAGVALWLLPRWVGGFKLPGDIFYKKGNVTIYFPVVTCILLSLLFTLISYLIHRFKQ